MQAQREGRTEDAKTLTKRLRKIVREEKHRKIREMTAENAHGISNKATSARLVALFMLYHMRSPAQSRLDLFIREVAVATAHDCHEIAKKTTGARLVA